MIPQTNKMSLFQDVSTVCGGGVLVLICRRPAGVLHRERAVLRRLLLRDRLPHLPRVPLLPGSQARVAGSQHLHQVRRRMWILLQRVCNVFNLLGSLVQSSSVRFHLVLYLKLSYLHPSTIPPINAVASTGQPLVTGMRNISKIFLKAQFPVCIRGKSNYQKTKQDLIQSLASG